MVSVIVPVYNAEKTIEKCVESILAQKVDKQILLINDGSKDDSLKILRRYEQENPNVIVVDKPNGGVSSARNAGLAVSSGEYVTFIDSDDYYTTDDYIFNLQQAIQQEPGIDLAITGYTILQQGRSKSIESLDAVMEVSYVAEHFLEYKNQNLMNSPCNKLFRRSLIQANFDERMKMGEDAVFVLAYLQNCKKLAFCSGCGYGYVFMNTSSTADFRKTKGYDIKQTNIYHSAIHKFLKTFLPEDEVADIYIRLRTNALYTIITTVLRKKSLPVFLKTNIDNLLLDEQLDAYRDRIISLSEAYEHKKLARLIQGRRAIAVKCYCLWHLLKTKLS